MFKYKDRVKVPRLDDEVPGGCKGMVNCVFKAFDPPKEIEEYAAIILYDVGGYGYHGFDELEPDKGDL